MKSISDRSGDRADRQTGSRPDDAAFHSRNLRRYFEGWSESREMDDTGRVRRRRVYTGVYHRARLSDGGIALQRLSYALLWLAAAALFVYAATRPAGNDAPVYVTVLQGVALIALAWLLWSLFNYLLSGFNMTLGEYYYAGALKRAALFSAAALAATAVGTLVHALGGGGPGVVLCIALYPLSALCCVGIFLIESRISYDAFPGKQTPEDSAG